MPWSSSFLKPVVLADGREIKTLREAGELMVALPKLHQSNGHWQEAARVMMIAVETPSPATLEAAGVQFSRALHEEGLMPFRSRKR